MKFLGGVAVNTASGSVGGVTASHNRGGQYLRRRAIPVNPASPNQLLRRATMGTLSQQWQALTVAQQLAWVAWARQNPVIDSLGQSILLSGEQAYIKLNFRLHQIGVSIISAPPITAAPAALTSLVADGDIGAGDMDLTFTATPLAASTRLWIEACLINSAGKRFVKNQYRFIGTSAAAQASPFDIQTLVTNTLGTPVVGQTLFVKAAVINTTTGLISPPLIDDVVVTST